MKCDYQVTLVPIVKTSKNGSPTSSQCSFKFMCQRSNSEILGPARELLEGFLISQNIPVFPTFKTHRRADSFAESLPHFDSKLLSAAHGESYSSPKKLVTYNIRAAPEMADRRLRMASSTPDVKALFNGSSNTTSTTSSLYQIEQEDYADENDSVYDSPSADYWTPLPSIVSRASNRLIYTTDAHIREEASPSLVFARWKNRTRGAPIHCWKPNSRKN